MKEELYQMLLKYTAINNLKLKQNANIQMYKCIEIALYKKALEETLEDMKKIILTNFMI